MGCLAAKSRVVRVCKRARVPFFRNEVLVVQNDIEKRTMNLQAALAIINEA
jgi:flagellar assembly factor FliW